MGTKLERVRFQRDAQADRAVSLTHKPVLQTCYRKKSGRQLRMNMHGNVGNHPTDTWKGQCPCLQQLRGEVHETVVGSTYTKEAQPKIPPLSSYILLSFLLYFIIADVCFLGFKGKFIILKSPGAGM